MRSIYLWSFMLMPCIVLKLCSRQKREGRTDWQTDGRTDESITICPPKGGIKKIISFMINDIYCSTVRFVLFSAVFPCVFMSEIKEVMQCIEIDKLDPYLVDKNELTTQIHKSTMFCTKFCLGWQWSVWAGNDCTIAEPSAINFGISHGLEFITNWNGLNNFDRGPDPGIGCEVWSKSNKWFQRRCCLKKLLTHGRTDGRTMDNGPSQKLSAQVS